MQVASRILLVWFVTFPFPQVAASPAYASMLVAWSVTEVIRYTYFGFNVAASPPDFLVWLRYNTFFVLYPLGILSEVWLILAATGPAGEVWFAYEWALYAVLAVYVPGEFRPAFVSWGVVGMRSLTGFRVVCAVHAHDQAAEEGYEEAPRGREEGAVKVNSGLRRRDVAACAGVMWWSSASVAMFNSSIVLSAQVILYEAEATFPKGLMRKSPSHCNPSRCTESIIQKGKRQTANPCHT